MSDQDITLYLVILWAVVATALCLEYRRICIKLHESLKLSFNLACHITKDEEIRKDFEINVVDKLIAANRKHNQ